MSAPAAAIERLLTGDHRAIAHVLGRYTHGDRQVLLHRIFAEAPGPHAWRANDVAALLSQGFAPEEIHFSPYRGLYGQICQDDEAEIEAWRDERAPRPGEDAPYVDPPYVDPPPIDPDPPPENWRDLAMAECLDPDPLAGRDGDTSPPPQEPSDDWPYERIDVRHCLLTPPPPISWLVRNRLQLGRGHGFAGIGGSSKTTLLRTLAVGAAVGRMPWQEWEIARTGRALLVLTEDTPGDTHRHVHATADAMRLSADERELVADRLVVFPLAGQTVKLLTIDRSGIPLYTNLFDGLRRLVESLGDVVLVGLDPAAALTDGQEVDQAHQRALGALADSLAVRTGAAVVLITHAAKGSSGSDELSSHMSRGGGAITDALRSEHALRTMTAREATAFGISSVEERRRYVQLAATKGNELPSGSYAPIWLRRGERGALFPADIEKTTRAVSDDALKALAILRELCATAVPKLEAWRHACAAGGAIRSADGEAGKKAMQRLVKMLLDAGSIEQGTGRGVYVPASGAEGAGR